MRVLRPFLILAMLLVSAAAAWSAPNESLDFPELTAGRVVDEAGILPQAKKVEIAAKLAALEDRTGVQFAVVTLAYLRGVTIAEYGVALGRHWRLGRKGKDDGVILLVAPNERKARIEVGYGLEGTLTDALCKVILETDVFPRFRAKDVAGGVEKGVDDVIGAIRDDAQTTHRLAGAGEREVVPGVTVEGPINGYVLLAIVLVMVTLIGLIPAFLVGVLITKLLTWIGVLPPAPQRTGLLRAFNIFDRRAPAPNPGRKTRRRRSDDDSSTSSPWSSSSDSSSSSSSSSGGSSSGGGGDFGGGGASGDW